MMKISEKPLAAIAEGTFIAKRRVSGGFLERNIPLSEGSLVFALLALIYCSAICLHIYSVVSLIVTIVSLL